MMVNIGPVKGGAHHINLIYAMESEELGGGKISSAVDDLAAAKNCIGSGRQPKNHCLDQIIAPLCYLFIPVKSENLY